jgi:hypothetical protein
MRYYIVSLSAARISIFSGFSFSPRCAAHLGAGVAGAVQSAARATATTESREQHLRLRIQGGSCRTRTVCGRPRPPSWARRHVVVRPAGDEVDELDIAEADDAGRGELALDAERTRRCAR